MEIQAFLWRVGGQAETQGGKDSLGDWAPRGRGKGRGRLKPSSYGVGRQLLVPEWGMSRIGKVRKEIGANVRTFRKKADLSQEKLGEKADLHPVCISQVEQGAKGGKRPKRVICGVKGSFPGSCACVYCSWLFSVRSGLGKAPLGATWL
jgi:hypothetical protein